jgi:hypothetical protein
MIVQNQQIERRSQPSNQRQADMMEVTGAHKRYKRLTLLRSPEAISQRAFKASKSAKAARHANVRAPVLRGAESRLFIEARLQGDSAIEIQHTHLHATPPPA